MGETGHPFWTALAAACLIWYSTVTIYVAIRGAFDIKTMLGHLRDRGNNSKNEADITSIRGDE
jgi:hypothetical protein